MIQLHLTRLLNYPLKVDGLTGWHAHDFVIGQPSDDYPPIRYVLWYNADHVLMRAPFTLEALAQPGKLSLAEQPAREEVNENWLNHAVLLRRDILDGLVLDLQKRSPALANDLWLEQEQDELVLKGVDISFRAILRRLSRGALARRVHPGLLDWKYIEYMHGNVQAAREGLTYHGLIVRLPPGEIAYLLDMLPYLYAAEMLTLLPDDVAADTLEMMAPTFQALAFEELDRKKARRLLNLMRPDVVADLLGKMDPEDARDWLEHLPHEQAVRVLALLSYPDDSAGGIMTNDMLTLPIQTSVQDALDVLIHKLRRYELVNFIYFIYIVRGEHQPILEGTLTIRDLLAADPRVSLSEVMNPFTLTLHPLEKARSAARRVIESGLSALPVVDENGKLVGVVTIDAALTLNQPGNARSEVLRIFT